MEQNDVEIYLAVSFKGVDSRLAVSSWGVQRPFVFYMAIYDM